MIEIAVERIGTHRLCAVPPGFIQPGLIEPGGICSGFFGGLLGLALLVRLVTQTRLLGFVDPALLELPLQPLSFNLAGFGVNRPLCVCEREKQLISIYIYFVV